MRPVLLLEDHAFFRREFRSLNRCGRGSMMTRDLVLDGIERRVKFVAQAEGIKGNRHVVDVNTSVKVAEVGERRGSNDYVRLWLRRKRHLSKIFRLGWGNKKMIQRRATLDTLRRANRGRKRMIDITNNDTAAKKLETHSKKN